VVAVRRQLVERGPDRPERAVDILGDQVREVLGAPLLGRERLAALPIEHGAAEHDEYQEYADQDAEDRAAQAEHVGSCRCDCCVFRHAGADTSPSCGTRFVSLYVSGPAANRKARP